MRVDRLHISWVDGRPSNQECSYNLRKIISSSDRLKHLIGKYRSRKSLDNTKTSGMFLLTLAAAVPAACLCPLLLALWYHNEAGIHL